MAEAQIRDEYGNPIQLTDQYGNPVKLTDEHGHPVRLTGVATTATTAPPTGSGFGTYGAGAYGGGATTHPTTTVADLMATEPATGTRQHHRHTDAGQLRRSSSSSSSSSEDDGQGGRRKKKGLKDKIKEKLPIGGSTQSQSQSQSTNTTTTTTTPAAAATSTTAPHEQQHEKKGIMDKIREKLPGGGHHTH